MALELETKFSLEDCLAFEQRMSAQCINITPWHFETNIVYDRNGELFQANMLLRLRMTDHGILTLKTPSPSHETGSLKARLETECSIRQPAELHQILCALGYLPRLRYEKFRSIWKLADAKLFLDILPFGHFLEIEGTEASIADCCHALGLNPQNGLAASYHGLHQAWRKQHALPPDDNFLFQDNEKNRLMLLLECTPADAIGEIHAH